MEAATRGFRQETCTETRPLSAAAVMPGRGGGRQANTGKGEGQRHVPIHKHARPANLVLDVQPGTSPTPTSSTLFSASSTGVSCSLRPCLST